MIQRREIANLDTAVATSGADDGGTGFAVDPALPGIGFGPALRSEMLKLLVLRSTTWLTVTAALVYAALAVVNGLTIGFLADTRTAEGSGAGFEAGALDYDLTVAEGPMVGTYLAIIVLGALGVLTVTSEFGSGSIRSALAAVPRRGLLFTAKGVALGACTAAIGVLVVALSYLLTLPFGLYYGLVPSLADPDVLSMYLTHVLSIVLCALLGLGIGAIFRSTAGGIVSLAALLFVLPLVLEILAAVRPAADIIETLLAGLPLMLLMDFTTTGSGIAWGAGAGLLAWAAGALIPGWALLLRRDA